MVRNSTFRVNPRYHLHYLKDHGRKIVTDLFELKGKSYLLLVDYFSRYIEVLKLTYTTTRSVVAATNLCLLGMAYQVY